MTGQTMDNKNEVLVSKQIPGYGTFQIILFY